MNKRIITSALIGLSLLCGSAFAALPIEGVYEKHTNEGKLQARMYVMGTESKSQYTFGYGNKYNNVIWVESFLPNGQKNAEFATKYIWKRDDVGAAETALILSIDAMNRLDNGDEAILNYARDMATFSFDGNGMADVTVARNFEGQPQDWQSGKVAELMNGKYTCVSDKLTFTPLSMAFAIESTSNPKRFYGGLEQNAEWNLDRLSYRKAGSRYEFVENLAEKGFLVKMDAELGQNVNMRAYYGKGVLTGSDVRLRYNASTDTDVIDMLNLDETVDVYGYEKGEDGRGWYYVKKANGKKGFAAAQFIELR